MSTVYVIEHEENGPGYRRTIICQDLVTAFQGVVQLAGMAIGRPERDFLTPDIWERLLLPTEFTELKETGVFEVEPDDVTEDYMEYVLSVVNQFVVLHSSNKPLVVRTVPFFEKWGNVQL